MRGWWNWQTHYLEVVAPQGMEVQVLFRAQGNTAGGIPPAVSLKNGAYSLVVKRWIVVPASRVRFPLGTPPE